jgi:hypothetical protein
MGLTPDLIQGAHHSYCKSRGTGPVPLCWPSHKGVFGTRRGSDRGSATRPAIPHAVAVTESKTRRFNERFSSRCELAHTLVTPGQHKLLDAGFVQQRGDALGQTSGGLYANLLHRAVRTSGHYCRRNSPHFVRSEDVFLVASGF